MKRKKIFITLFLLLSLISCKNTFVISDNNEEQNDINNSSLGVKLEFLQQPFTTIAGQAINPSLTIKVLDANDELVLSNSTVITLSIGNDPSSGSASLGGTTSVTTSNGIATFNDITIDKAFDSYTLVASSGSLTSATSNSFDISYGLPSALVFEVNPLSTVVNYNLNPAIEVKVVDDFGNLVTSASNSISIAISTDPSGIASLSGTSVVNAISGVATFNDLKIDTVASGFILQATSISLTSDNSSSFAILNPYTIASGFISNCIKLSSSTKCFGQGADYVLGNGTQDDTINMTTPAPTDVLNDVGLVATDIVSTNIPSDGSHACTLLTSGEVRCMGMGANGERGDGTNSNTALPTYIQKGVSINLDSITKVSTGGNLTCAIDNADDLYCMGKNNSSYHYLVSGSTCSAFLDSVTCEANLQCYWSSGSSICIADPSVEYAVNIQSNVSDVAIGSSHICINDTSGQVKCWGENTNGELGNGNNTDITTGIAGATNVSGLAIGTVVDLQAGCGVTCALLNDSTVKCWGRGLDGQLGINSLVSQNTAQQVLDSTGLAPLSNISQMAIGCFHSCFLNTSNEVYCVGNNQDEQLNGSLNPKELLVVKQSIENIIQVGVTYTNTCVINTNNKVYCWGSNASGESGHTGDTTSTPIEVLNL